MISVVSGTCFIEELAREQAVFGGGDERFHLGGSAREQDGEVAAFYFAVFAVGAAVVGEAVVVEGLAHGVAPVAVFRADGGGDGIGFAFAYQADAFGVHDVLQDARAGVVARDEEHAVDDLFVGEHYDSNSACHLFSLSEKDGQAAPA